MTLEQAESLWRKSLPMPPGNGDLLREIKHAARQFRLQILIRDLAELTATLLVVASFVYAALRPGVPQSAYLSAAGLALVPMVFLGVHRLLKRESQRPQETVREHIEQALRDVLGQQWLLTRVLWWYLLPFALSIGIFFVATVRVAPGALPVKLITLGIGALVCGALGVFIWRLNQREVRVRLEPFAEHLRQLAESLRGA
jgi:hypothetical protein